MFQAHGDKFTVLHLPRTDEQVYREQGKGVQHVLKPGQRLHKSEMLSNEMNLRYFVICLAYFQSHARVSYGEIKLLVKDERH